MFRAGDEFLNTQFGNNNPYNQDNEIGWLDWSQLRSNEDIFRFFQRMIAFRKNHPSLSRSRFWREDVSWYGVVPTMTSKSGTQLVHRIFHRRRGKLQIRSPSAATQTPECRLADLAHFPYTNPSQTNPFWLSII